MLEGRQIKLKNKMTEPLTQIAKQNLKFMEIS